MKKLTITSLITLIIIVLMNVPQSLANKTLLTTFPGNFRLVIGSGDWIIWRSATGASRDDINMYDIATDTKKQIINGLDFEFLGDFPLVSHDWLVFGMGPSISQFGYSNLYIYDIAKGVGKQLWTTNDNSFQEISPLALSGNKIFALKSDYSKMDNFYIIYDIETEEMTELYDFILHDVLTDGLYYFYISMSENRIVWPSSNYESPKIYIYDIATGVETQIMLPTEKFPGMPLYPIINGDYLTWSDQRNGNHDIFLYKIVTGVETQITDDPIDQWIGRFLGNKLCWSDKRNGKLDRYCYDIVTGVETQITDEYGIEFFCGLTEDRILWMEKPNDNYLELYLYEGGSAVTTSTPTTTTTANGITTTTTTTTNGVTTTTTSGRPPCPLKEIYGTNSQETQLLRSIRDNVLSQTHEGKELIKLYYQWSPVIVKAMEQDEDFKEDIKDLVDEIMGMVE